MPNLRVKEKKKKTVEAKKEAPVLANTNALALVLKPASPTPSNTMSARSFYRDTERE